MKKVSDGICVSWYKLANRTYAGKGRLKRFRPSETFQTAFLYAPMGG
jgi:hypothetical protein